MPTVQGYVLYPNEEDDWFDLGYYMRVHMPLVETHWRPLGLKGWEVTNITNGSDNVEAAYTIVTILEWETKEALKAALLTPAAKEIAADTPNFSNKTPVMFAGDVVAGFGTLALERPTK